MLFVVFLFFLFKDVSPACYINIDKGTYEQFNALKFSNFQCLNGEKFFGSVEFEGVFSETPQIIITMLSYKYDRNAQFRFKILTQTTTEFTFQIQCFSAQVHKYEFQWIAINDNNMYVINDYMDSTQLVNAFESPPFTFPIQNAQYFVVHTIISYFGGDAALYAAKNGQQFTLKVDKATSGLGVQIIAGLTTTYFQYGQFTAPFFNNMNVQSMLVDNPNYIPIFNQIYWFENNDNGELYRELFYIYSKSGNMIRGYEIQGSGWGQLAYLPYVYNFQSQLYYPHHQKKIRVSKKRCSDYKIYIAFEKQQLNIIEVNKTLIDISQYSMDYNSKPLSLIYLYKCQPYKKVIAKVLRCGKSEEYYYDVTQFCNRGYNLMTMNIYLYQNYPSLSQIQFDLTDLGFKVTQTMLGNQDIYVLIDLQITTQY